MKTFPTSVEYLIDPANMQYYLNDKTLAPLRKFPICVSASVYRMSAGNSMPYNKQIHPQEESKFFITGYQRNESPWSFYLQRYKKLEDTNSSSSSLLDSSCSSSRSESPEPQKKHKKKSYHMLLREIHRLRNENTSLRASVTMLKNDLRDITLSRQDTDASHKKFYDEYMDKNTQLEIDVEDRNDEIKTLKEQVDRLKQCHLCHSNNSNHQRVSSGSQNPFGCYEFDEEDDMFCQPVAQESALPEMDVKMDELKLDDNDEIAMNDYMQRRFNLVDISQQEDDEEDDDEEEEKENGVLFESTATSYLHQALISKLSSARVRLELDDLILKYEPSTQDVVRVLSAGFVSWVSSLLVKHVKKTGDEPVTATKVFTSYIQNGIVGFWESLLQYYTEEEENQVDLLNCIENNVEMIPSCSVIGDHFDRLVLMLYKHHVIDDDAVISWWQNPIDDNENAKKIRKITTRFVEWVQDEDEEEEEDDDEDEEDEDDDNDNDSEDDEIFSFVESPSSEEQIELNNNDNNSETVDNSINDLLNSQQDREPCICQFDKDTTTNSKKNEPCSCSTYTPVIEKKKKSVRIAM